MDTADTPADIDAYIAAAPAHVRAMLTLVRTTVARAAPEATEAISYRMPTFKLRGNLVHFAAFAQHIGFYPGSGAVEAFRDELSDFKTSKGAIQFPVDRPIPVALITRITKYRVKASRAAKAPRKRTAG
ncbi:MAG: DUF1801 domain-containing protein [Gemmatimonadota bacterium]